MANIPSLLDMLQAGVHFGHQANKWHPKMAPFIFGERNGVHIIDLEKTQKQLEEAMAFVKESAAMGRLILIVGTKEQAKSLVKKAAEDAGLPYITERWLGGLLTNFNEIQTLLKKYNRIKNWKETNEIAKYTKKEQTHLLKEMTKMEKFLSGITKLERRPEIIFIIDLKKEKTAFREALQTNTKIIALCDTNINPEGITYPIASNDDATKTIELMLNTLVAFYKEGTAIRATMPAQPTAEAGKTGAPTAKPAGHYTAPGMAFVSE